MKSHFLLSILVTGLFLTGGEVSPRAIANTPAKQIAQSNQEDLENWQPTQDEEKRWDEDLISQSFADWFAGIELTPAQEKFAKAENARYYYKLQDWGDRADAEGREWWKDPRTDVEMQALDNEFFQRLKAGLTKDDFGFPSHFFELGHWTSTPKMNSMN